MEETEKIEKENARRRVEAEKEKEEDLKKIKDQVIKDAMETSTALRAQELNSNFKFSVERPRDHFDHVHLEHASFLETMLTLSIVYLALDLCYIALYFAKIDVDFFLFTYMFLPNLPTLRYFLFVFPVLLFLFVYFLRRMYLNYTVKYKVQFKYADIDTESEYDDRRTDDQKRSDLKHNKILKTRVKIKYYMKIYCYDLWTMSRSLKYVTSRRRETYISFEMLAQLSKHANNNLNNDPDVCLAKLNQHASYLCSINLNRHNLTRHMVQDTVLIAQAWYKHNVQTHLHEELFRALQQ